MENGESSSASVQNRCNPSTEFGDWVRDNGGNDQLSLHHLNLESRDAKSLAEKLNYGQKCFMQGLVRLCEAHNDAKANSYGFAIGRARSLKGKTGTLKEKLHKVFNFSG